MRRVWLAPLVGAAVVVAVTAALYQSSRSYEELTLTVRPTSAAPGQEVTLTFSRPEYRDLNLTFTRDDGRRWVFQGDRMYETPGAGTAGTLVPPDGPSERVRTITLPADADPGRYRVCAYAEDEEACTNLEIG